ncbi:hypothetical protein F5887DRAFT_1068755 [Amanita rubescens]|nr:hypothetical protein F5887DRAFT_1068755 [Amanita rubescens]
MHRPGPRLHRLPQRLDYTLIPAPLDLSLTSMSEKSPLPAIIVTPSSPSSSHDYSIAFLAPPPKPTFPQRVISSCQNALQPRARTTLIFTFIFFLLLCHYLAHRIATSRSHLDILPMENDFGSQLDVPGANSWFGDWLDLSAFWNDPSQRKPVGDFARILDSGS